MSLCEAGNGIASKVSVDPSSSSSSSTSSSSGSSPKYSLTDTPVTPPVAPVTPPLVQLAEDFKEPRSEAAVATDVPATSTVVGKKKATASNSVPANQVDSKPRVKLVPKAKLGWVKKAKVCCYSFACACKELCFVCHSNRVFLNHSDQ